MEFNKLRLLLSLKIFLILLVSITSIYFLIPKEGRNHLFSYFSTRCLDYRQKDFSRKLNDRIVDYSYEARMGGISICNNPSDLKKKISEGRLVKVKNTNKYIVERMVYSQPYLTKRSKLLLDEIASRFREKTSQKGLKGSRFYITSMTRITENVKKLRRNNSNASANSPHLYGNAFDISYKRFSVRKMVITNCDGKFLKEAMAEVIWQLSEEKKCWATYEKGQNCFHVVAR
jgi:hypothetical protein